MANCILIGAPIDEGQRRPGCLMGPAAYRVAGLAAAIRDLGHGVQDWGDLALPELRDVTCPNPAVHSLAEVVGWTEVLADKVEDALAGGGLPVVLGGDHSVNIPCIAAFDADCAAKGPIHIVQIDAHLDFVDERHGVRYGHGSPMRRAAERDYVTGLTQLGIRNVSSTAKDGYDAARAMGADILSVRQVRKLGVEAVLERIPKGVRTYVTIDIDGFDPSIAPGTGTPSHGGFTYYEGLELLAGLAQRNPIVGIDLVEVAPDYDHSGSTAILAAQLLMNLLGRIFHARGV